jgi:hypothetical protein
MATSRTCLVMLLALVAAGFSQATLAEEVVSVEGLDDGQPVKLGARSRSTLSRLALEALRSATFEAPAEVASKELWEKTRQGPHFRLVFVPPRAVSFGSSTTRPTRDEKVRIDELVIPLVKGRAPEYIWVADGSRVRAFAKYGPGELEALRKALAKSIPRARKVLWPAMGRP